MIAPVWRSFAGSEPSVVVGAGKMVVELGVLLDDVDDVDDFDELERVFEDVLCEDVLEEVIEDSEEVAEMEGDREGEEEEGGVVDESVVGAD